MFGKGIYFADMASKSANYCMPSYQNKTGLLVLCDVSLGKFRELLDADYKAEKLPSGYHSVKGLGKTAPDPKNSVTLSDGVVVPMGPGVDTKIQNKSGYTLQYNEYIVYDVSQVKIKYLFKIEFDFNYCDLKKKKKKKMLLNHWFKKKRQNKCRYIQCFLKISLPR
ncbi:Poly [ADP-ribose] polymerase 2 [Armadillidium nasatum]|uniref:Poly [ADP-ribose] polymerase n=1 Tax=Armadillidium nasatum TaxID=96803 RepID=A0A5N5TGC8_9CRUS|nr:Poly [ADP-ribose] polymerase 2 [Armadillidium nasatum]